MLCPCNIFKQYNCPILLLLSEGSFYILLNRMTKENAFGYKCLRNRQEYLFHLMAPRIVYFAILQSFYNLYQITPTWSNDIWMIGMRYFRISSEDGSVVQNTTIYFVIVDDEFLYRRCHPDKPTRNKWTTIVFTDVFGVFHNDKWMFRFR